MMVRHGDDAYPLGRVILDRARTALIARGELVRRLGYRNSHTGHNALSDALTSGRVPVEMSDRLADALAVPQDLVDAVITATAPPTRRASSVFIFPPFPTTQFDELRTGARDCPPL
jgi:hypothetical protein